MEWYIVGLCLLLFFAALIYAAVNGEEEFQRWRERGVKTQGVVVRNEFQPGDIASCVRPVVRFSTQQGEVIEAMDRKSAAAFIPSYAVGTTVTLLYEPTNPYECEVLGAGRIYPWAETNQPAAH